MLIDQNPDENLSTSYHGHLSPAKHMNAHLEVLIHLYFFRVFPAFSRGSGHNTGSPLF